MKVLIGLAMAMLVLVLCYQGPAESRQAIQSQGAVATGNRSASETASEAARGAPVTRVRAPRINLPLFNTIYDGNDYHHFRMTTDQWSECARACKNDRRCRAWSMVKGGTGCEPTGPLCWLKTRTSTPRENVCAISGRK